MFLLQAETVDQEFHDDDDFTKTLQQMDEQQAKKVCQRTLTICTKEL
jgi:hypothetical protein